MSAYWVLIAAICGAPTVDSVPAIHHVQLSGGVNAAYAAQSVVVANRNPGDMQPTGHFNLALRDPSERKRSVQFAMIQPDVTVGTYDLARRGLNVDADRILACLYLPAGQPRPFKLQDIHCQVESGLLTITDNGAHGLSGEFSFRVLRQNAKPVEAEGYFNNISAPEGKP